MTAQDRPRWGHVPGLDGLRGLAVAGVVLYHGGHLTGGYLGVDLFFTLSGFLITSLLLAEVKQTGGIRLGAFWGRRARRLLPAVFGLLIGVAVFARFWATPDGQRSIRGDSLATLLYVANWRSIVAEQGYWTQFGVPSPLQHTWSLAIEEQFYLVWPLVVLGLARVGRRWHRSVVALVGIVGAAASYVWMAVVHDPGHDASRAYFGTDTRVGGVLVGAVLAAVLAGSRSRSGAHARRQDGPVWVEALGLLGATWLAWAWIHIDGQESGLYHGGFVGSAFAGLALIATAVLRPGGPTATALSLAPLRGLGTISYGLYLWHWPVFVVLQIEQPLGLDGWGLFALKVAVSLALALVSYHLLEQPIRTRGLAAWGRGRGGWMPAAATLSVVLVLVTTTTLAGPSLTTRAPVDEAPIPTVVPDAGPGPARPVEGPQARPAGRDPRLLVVGDSVAIDLAEGLAADPAAHLDVLNRAVWACRITETPLPTRMGGVISTIEEDNCPPQRDRWREAVAAFDPDAALISFGGGIHGEVEIDGRWTAPCTDAFVRRWTDATLSAIDLLASQGAVVWVLLPPPADMVFEPEGLAEGMQCVRDVYADAVAARPDVARAVPLDEWVCPDGECVLERDGVTLRPDGLHYRDGGQAVAGAWLASQLFEPPASG